MTRHSFKNTAAGALMGVAAIFAPIAATAQDANNPPAKTMTSDDYPAATHDEAKAASVGQIVLHYGEGFDPGFVRAAINVLKEHEGYRNVTAFSGAEVPEHVVLCVGGACYDHLFSIGDLGFAALLLEQDKDAQAMRSTAPLQTTSPTIN